MRHDRDPADHHLYAVGGTWYVKIWIGREIRRSLRTTDRQTARRRRDALIAELRGETHGWREAVGRWLLEWLPENVDPATAKRYAVSIGQIAPALVWHDGAELRLEDMPIERVTLKTVGEVVAWSKRHRPGATHATIRRDLTAWSSVMHACIGWGWREDNPPRAWDRSHIKERREPIVLPTDAQVEALIALAPGNFGRAIRFLDVTGMRAMEAFNLRRDQLAADRSGATLGAGTKGNRVRFVPFAPAAVSIVDSIPAYLKSPWVFWHGTGEPYRNVSARVVALRRRLAAAAAGAGDAVEFSLHDLRHRFAVRYLRQGGGIYDLQLILGHRSIKTTEIYLDFLDPDTRQRAIRRAGGSA